MSYRFTTGSVNRGDIYYEDDAGKNTYLDWAEDQLDIVVGAKSMIKMVEASTDKITINNGGSNVDLQIKSNNNANLIRTDGGNDRVGIGTSSPTSTFEISGSQAGNYAQTTGDITFNETHYIVDYTGNGAATFTLPDVSGITGRIYHIMSHNQHETAALTITGSGGQFQGPHLDQDSNSIDIDGWTPQSVTVVSTGGNWFILVDNRTQGPG